MPTQSLKLEQVSKVYFRDIVAVKDLNLDIAEGQFVTILGPSGCGKSSTLRMIAGLEQLTTGRVWIGDVDVTHLPTHKRNIGVVFQSYALFPHMTVRQNIGFGLEMRAWPKNEIDRRIGELLDIIRLPDIGDRFPAQLSGGQQQRVALARALAPKPEVLLLDEPLSNLDLKLRQDLRLEIRRIQRELAITTVFVTHDQGEALALSDRVLIMNDGQISQMGTPTEVYESPRNSWVASFLGDANVFSGRVSKKSRKGSLLRVDDLDLTFEVWADTDVKGDVSIAMRPEVIKIKSDDTETDDTVDSCLGFVSNRAYVGSATRYVVRMLAKDDKEILVDVPTAGRLWNEGDQVRLMFPRDRWVVLEKQEEPNDLVTD